MIRCSHCGYTWQQSVVHAIEVREQQITMPAPAPAVAAPVAPVVVETPPPPPPPPEPEPIIEPEPEPEPTPEPDSEPTPEPEPESESESESEEVLDQASLDNLFDEEQEPIEAMESSVDSNIDGDEAETIDISDLDMDADEDVDEDPIPESLAQPLREDDDEIPVARSRFQKPRPEKNGGMLKKVTIALALLLLVLVVGLFAAKAKIIDMFPVAKTYYGMVGLYHEEPGEGLATKNVKPRRDLRGGVEFLIVEGLVENITEAPIHIPTLQVSLANTKGKAVASEKVKLSKEILKPGETVSFKVEFENPPGTARKMTVKFLDDMAMQGDGESNGKGEN